MRKWMTWLLALLLVCAVAAPLQAADSSKSGTIKGGTIKSKTHSWKKHRKVHHAHKSPNRWSRSHHSQSS